MSATAPTSKPAGEQELAALLRHLCYGIADCCLPQPLIAQVLGIGFEDLCQLSVRRPPSAATEHRLRLLLDVLDLSTLIFGSREAAGRFLCHEGAQFGDRSPLRMVGEEPDKLSWLRQMLEDQCVADGLIPAPVTFTWKEPGPTLSTAPGIAR